MNVLEDPRLTAVQELDEATRLLHRCLVEQRAEQLVADRAAAEQAEADARAADERREAKARAKAERARAKFDAARVAAAAAAALAEAQAAAAAAAAAAQSAAQAGTSTADGEELATIAAPAAPAVVTAIVAPVAAATAKPADDKKQNDDDDDEDEAPQKGGRPKVVPPPRASFNLRKLAFRHIKVLIGFSLLQEPSKHIVHHHSFDDFFSVAFEYLSTFRDVGMAVVVLAFACNVCAHAPLRPALDGTALVQWFVEVALLFTALKRVVHLSLLGVANAAMCRDMRLGEEDARKFAMTICRLAADARVVEAWSCAIINLVGSGPATNGAMLLKHDAFDMVQRLLLLHGTEDAVAARAMQAMTCLALVFFPAKAASAAAGSPKLASPQGSASAFAAPAASAGAASGSPRGTPLGK